MRVGQSNSSAPDVCERMKNRSRLRVEVSNRREPIVIRTGIDRRRVQPTRFGAQRRVEPLTASWLR